MSEEPITTEVTGVEGTVPNITPTETPAPVEFSNIVPESFSDKPWVKDVKDVEGLFKMTDDLKTKLGERPAGIPQNDAGNEAWAEFNKAFGVPESGEEYQLSDPQEGAEDFQKQVRDMFLAAGVSQRQANMLDASFNKIMESLAPNPEANEAEFVKMTDEAFGNRKDTVLDNAKNLLEAHVPEAFKEHVNTLPNKELTILASVLDSIQQKYINESDIPPGGSTTSLGMSTEQKRARGIELMSSPAWKNKSHPQHAAVAEEVARIYSS